MHFHLQKSYIPPSFLFLLLIFSIIKLFSTSKVESSHKIYVSTPVLTFGSYVASNSSNMNTSPIIISVTPIPSVSNGLALHKLHIEEVKGMRSENVFISDINEYRNSKGLREIFTDSQSCNFATVRATEVSSDFSHAGFESRRNSHNLPYSGWSAVVENIAMSESPVEMWKNSPSHNANLLADITYGCVMSRGNYYVFEGWK